MVDMLRPLLVAGIGRTAVTTSFFSPLLLRHSPVMIAPNPIDPLDVERPMVFLQLNRNPAIAIARMLFNLLLDRFDYRSILDRQPQFIPLGTPGLVQSLTRFPLGYAQLSTGQFHRLTLLSRA